MARVCVKNTFISFTFEGEVHESKGRPAMSRSKSMERMAMGTVPLIEQDVAVSDPEQMLKLERILDDDQEAVRNATSPISSPKDASAEFKPKEAGEPRKWSEESSTGTASDGENKEIRPSMSNSSVSTMTSFEANRSRACSNGSIGSISSYEFKEDPVEFDLKIEEEYARPPTPWMSHWHANNYHTEMKWKPKGKQNYGGFGYTYHRENKGTYLRGDSSSGESMKGSPFTTPSQSPKCPKEMMYGRNLPRDSRHNRVPRNVNLQEKYQTNQQEVTTLMIRNIPNRYTQRELNEELKDLGFEGTFDFLYSPLDKGTMSNVGYAFVNFKSHEFAAKCIKAFDNYRFKRHRKTSGKVAAVSAAHLQGLEANLAHYEKTAVNNAKMKQRRPLVLANISGWTQS